jgi:anti-sigma regulatory factor (Ser/Thr protein kinase)
MEMKAAVQATRIAAHVAFEVRDSSQPGEVRRAAVKLAHAIGFDEVAAGRVALVATELGSNLVKHAEHGMILLGAVRADDGGLMVELLSLDKGPGIADLQACVADGFSTGGTAGTGLGAVRRQAAAFDVFSQTPGGTVILARIAAAPPAAQPMPIDPASLPAFAIGAVAVCAPGETACGDAWDAVQVGRNLAVMVADGLGHGPGAAEASEAATAVFRADPLGVPSQVLAQAHRALKTTRGAAISMAQIDLDRQTIVFCGVGNVTGRIITAVEDRTLMSHNGTAGLQIRTARDVSHGWTDHSVLVMHSDGIAARWNLKEVPQLLQHHPAVLAAWLIREHCRGRDDATVVAIRRRDV